MSHVVTVLIDDVVYDDVVAYAIESHMLSLADAFSLSIANPGGKHSQVLDVHMPVKVLLDDTVQMTGYIDEVAYRVDPHGGSVIEVIGRDVFGQLMDCSAEPKSYGKLTLRQIAETFSAPYVTTWRYHNEENRNRLLYAAASPTNAVKRFPTFPDEYRSSNEEISDAASIAITSKSVAESEKYVRVKVEPGESRAEVINRYASRANVWCWCAADGSGVISKPNYNQSPRYSVRLHPINSAQRAFNNVLSAEAVHHGANVYSDYRMMSYGSNTSGGYGASVRYDMTATSATRLARKLVQVGQAQTRAQLSTELQRDVSQREFEAVELAYVVPGHAQDGLLYQADTLCDVTDEVTGHDDVYYVVGRRFEASPAMAQQTQLLLRKRGMWLP